MIILADIGDGDEVIVQDEDGNRARGPAHYTPMRDRLYLQIFGTRVDFGRKTAGGWQRANHITVIGHQGALL